MTWEVIHGDCLEVLKTIPDGSVDAVVTDPPYGIALNARKKSKHIAALNHKTIEGDDQPFDPSPWLSFPKVAMWGANNYASKLPDMGGWLIWDKVTRDGLKVRIAECEMAWTNCVRRTQALRHMWSGAFRASERGTSWHPCQKPVALMAWMMDRMGIPEGDTVLDPFMGSGTTGVACVQTGRNFIGIELDEGYCNTARERIAKAEAEMAELLPGVTA